MSELEILNLKCRDIDKMKTVRLEENSPKTKIWLYEDTMYKRDSFQIIRRFSDYIRIFKDCKDLDFCVFPDKLFYVDGKYVGYTMPYYKDYKSINFRLQKNNFKLKDKKELMFKLYKMIKTIHEYEFIHCDAKCANFIWKDKDIKLIDFERMKIKECEDYPYYKMDLQDEINHLNLVLLSVLFDKDMSFVDEHEYREFINEIDLFKEFKEYLLNCSYLKELEVSKELPKYINAITKKNIIEGKELVKSLQI